VDDPVQDVLQLAVMFENEMPIGVTPITVVARVVHPFASVVVKVYVVFAQRPVADVVVPPVGAHAYVTAPVAPVNVTMAPPLHAALHDALVFVVAIVTDGVFAMFTTAELAHATLYESVTVTV